MSFDNDGDLLHLNNLWDGGASAVAAQFVGFWSILTESRCERAVPWPWITVNPPPAELIAI